MSDNAPADFVSVVIPTHNRAHYILDAVVSALNQGPEVGEVIVVDDGSTDNTLAVLQRVSDSRLRVLRQTQSGPVAARNQAWQQARGRWIQFLDSDDGLETGAVPSLLAAARKNPARIAYGIASVHAQKLELLPHYTFCFAHRSGNILSEFCFYAGGTILSCLLPRPAIVEVGGFGGFPESADCEDFDFGLRLALRYEFTYVSRICYKIRMHDANRHRPMHRQVWVSSMACVERRLPSTPRYWLLKQRCKAYYKGLVADYDLANGDVAGAVRGYWQCLAWWPIKFGAWKGLSRALQRKMIR
ncbi:MAG: glycosyltransferase [Verrucomicrobiota bacterium]